MKYVSGEKDMYVVYALRLNDGKVYVGMTNNLERRVLEHRRGKNRYTKNKIVVSVSKLETCVDSCEARQREKYWKSGIGREKLRQYYRGVEQPGSSCGS